MSGWLAARHAGAAAYTLTWCYDTMRSKSAGLGGEITIRTAEPTRDIEHLTRLLAENLAKVELLAPVGDLRLVAIDVLPLDGKSLSLLPEQAQTGESLALVLERIAARLGPERVLRPVVTEDHRLEWMTHWQPAPRKLPRQKARTVDIPQPTFVLDAPLRLAMRGPRPLYQGRLQPRCFYDLVVEVALVRPGPIVGGMVHPYLRRRQGLEPVTYPSEALREALGRTLGVPVFQEQVMQISILAAGFTPGEADGLRRAMAAWKRKGGLERYYSKIVDGMTSRGYEKAFAEQIFEQIKGFSEYGFPESHAASFALIVYASSWLKCHHPAEFLAGMLNAQPMGFYSPSQLVQDAKRHGVEVRPPDVMHSDVDCTLEGLPHPPAVRLGLRMLQGLRRESAENIVAARVERGFDSAEDLARRAGLEHHEVKLLAGGDALRSLSGRRRQQVWEASALRSTPKLLRDAPVEEDLLELDPAPEGEEVVFDYAATGLTLRRHPLAPLRAHMIKRRLMSAADLHDLPNGRLVRYCGLVTLRQQPETANGVIFVSLEDETGVVQVICWRSIREKQRTVLLKSRLLAVYGTWQREGELRSLVAGRLEDLTPLLGRLAPGSRDFR